MADGSPTPGWYQDPKDAGQVRWWDGNGWTHNTQPMPGAPAAEPVAPAASAAPEVPAASDPWAAASQPEQQWGQQPVQPDQQWGQQPVHPDQQWGQQPVQPEQPAGPDQQQWGQPGGWQQPNAQGWGSAVPPAAVPGGLAPGSPMGQTNVFPTAETVDPITGMPVGKGTGDSGGGSSPKRLAALVVGALLVGLLIIFLLWIFLFRESSSNTGAGTNNGQVNVTATFSGTVDPACSDLGAALTADGLTDTVATRLNDVASAKDLEENQAYFDQLSKDIKPIMDQYQDACVAAVSAGNAPEFYRTFVETFNSAVSDGEAVATTALGAGGQVPAADADRLRAESSKLSAAGQAVMAITGTPTPSTSPTAAASPTLSPSPAATSPAP